MKGEANEYTIEKRYVRKDGCSIWVLLTATLFRDAERRPLRILAMIQDIHARKQGEVLVHCQKMALEKVAQGASLSDVLDLIILAVEKIADQSLISILLLDESGEHLRMGAAPSLPEAYRVVADGLPVDAANTPCARAVRERRPVIIPNLDNAPEWAGFARLVEPFGVRAAWSTPIISSDQKVLGSFCCYFRRPQTPSDTEQWMVENVTRTIALAIERKRAEFEREALLRREQFAREQAEETSQIKDEFLMVVSHELRTPLNAINGWVYLLLGGRMDAAAQHKALLSIQRNVHSQRRLIDDLLDVARIASGKTRLELRPIEPSKVIASALDVVRPAAEAKRIDVVVHADGSRNLIWADPDRLQQVIWNLLSNAIKFTPPGGHVDVSTRQTDSNFEIRVADTGQGIHADFLPHVFERFRQADASTTRAHAGLGLGLAIVRHLIEMHGGTVSAESEGAGRGATFIICLPIRADRQQVSAERFVTPERRVGAIAGAVQNLNGLRVLVVDDDLDTGEALMAVLTQHGARATACASAAEALMQFEHSRPDILVADIGMPGEDGYSLIRKIRARSTQQGGRTPGIALTAYAGDANRRRAIEAGFQEHMVKPVEPDELISAISQLASLSKS